MKRCRHNKIPLGAAAAIELYSREEPYDSTCMQRYINARMELAGTYNIHTTLYKREQSTQTHQNKTDAVAHLHVVRHQLFVV